MLSLTWPTGYGDPCFCSWDDSYHGFWAVWLQSQSRTKEPGCLCKVGLVQDLCTSPAAVLLEEASAIILPNPCPPPATSWGVSVPHLKVRWLPSPQAANSSYLKPFTGAGTGCRAVGVAARGANNLLQEAGITAWRSSSTHQRGGGECSCSPHGLTIPPPGRARGRRWS